MLATRTFDPELLLALPGHCVMRRGQGLRPFPRTPFSTSSFLPSLRSGQVSLDEAEHFLHNRDASVASLRWCSGSVPERRSESFRNKRSASPESPKRTITARCAV